MSITDVLMEFAYTPTVLFACLTTNLGVYISELAMTFGVENMMEKFGFGNTLAFAVTNMQTCFGQQTTCPCCVRRGRFSIKNFLAVVKAAASSNSGEFWDVVSNDAFMEDVFDDFINYCGSVNSDPNPTYESLITVYWICEVFAIMAESLPTNASSEIEKMLVAASNTISQVSSSSCRVDYGYRAQIFMIRKSAYFVNPFKAINAMIPEIARHSTEEELVFWKNNVRLSLACLSYEDVDALPDLVALLHTFEVHFRAIPFPIGAYIDHLVRKKTYMARMSTMPDLPLIPYNCIACENTPREVVSMACGHVSMCQQCSEKLHSQICPICRKPTLFLKLIIS